MRKSLMSIAIILLLITICFSIETSAVDSINTSSRISRSSTIIVDQSGSGDYTTIQDALDSASSGDKIIIRSGIYSENIFVNSSIQIEGMGDSTHLMSSGGTGIVINSNNVSISRLKISNYYNGIYTNNHKNIPISNITIENTTEHSIYFEGVSERIIIKNNIIKNIENFGIYIEGNNNNINNNLVSNLTYGGSGGNAIVIKSSKSVVHHNQIYDIQGCGITPLQLGFNGLYFHNNTVINSSVCGIVISYYNGKVENSLIMNCAEGLSAYGLKIRVINVTIINSSQRGMWIGSRDISITKCNVSDCGIYGAYLYGTSSDNNITFQENSIINNQHGIFLDAPDGFKLWNNSNGVSI